MLHFTAIFKDGTRITKSSKEVISDYHFRNWIIKKKLDLKHGSIVDITSYDDPIIVKKR